MFSVRFLQSGENWNQLPTQLPHVVISGRSNCGKSSFINALAGQKIAKVSQVPGKTRLLNLFSFQDKFFLVDTPGYGYAARSHGEKEKWKPMMENLSVPIPPYFRTDPSYGYSKVMVSRRRKPGPLLPIPPYSCFGGLV